MLVVYQRIIESPLLEDVLIGEVIAVFEICAEVGFDAVLVGQRYRL